MSRHHTGQGWSGKSPRLRAAIRAQLPLPCLECGRPVGAELPDSAWHVGHRRPASAGGLPTVENTGPVHVACNLRTGGKLGAAVTNRRRAWREGKIREW